jgi:AcrR family transcriptional regulator
MSDTSQAPLLSALWRVIALQGWPRATMRAIAAEAGVSLADLRRRYGGPAGMLLAHARAVDEEVLAGTVDDPDSTPRDRLFDVLMRRLDALQRDREGVVRLMEDLRRDPVMALALGAQLPVSMGWMLEAADIPSGGPAGAARGHGLGLVWLDTLRHWAKDESADLSATMAALDRALDRADRAVRFLRLGDAPASPASVEAAGGIV